MDYNQEFCLQIVVTEACFETCKKVLPLLKEHPFLSDFNLSIDTYDMCVDFYWISNRDQIYLWVLTDGTLEISSYLNQQSKYHQVTINNFLDELVKIRFE